MDWRARPDGGRGGFGVKAAAVPPSRWRAKAQGEEERRQGKGRERKQKKRWSRQGKQAGMVQVKVMVMVMVLVKQANNHNISPGAGLSIPGQLDHSSHTEQRYHGPITNLQHPEEDTSLSLLGKTPCS